MKFLGNVFWLFFGGFELAVAWFTAGIICCITVVGIPLGIQCMKFAGFVLWPFGRSIQRKFGVGKMLANIVWVVFFGWWLALASAIFGVLYCITVIGIPFGVQCFKFASLAFSPFGAEIV